ncbi:MAG TPA: iron hydrogenase small subunit, partial [Syntrophomonas sp.]|nr:iron hydrogenase small subunit [Syntrophomonas sp.]
MSIFTEKVGMTRRQFLKGSGMLAVAVIVTGVFA